MTKKCAFEGCNNEVNQWQTYCSQHYQMLMQQQGAVLEQPPQVPMQKVSLPKQILPQQSEGKLPSFQVPPQEKPTKASLEPADKQIMIRKECLKCAVDLMIESDQLNKPYAELLGQISTLVEDFNKIVNGTFGK